MVGSVNIFLINESKIYNFKVTKNTILLVSNTLKNLYHIPRFVNFQCRYPLLHQQLCPEVDQQQMFDTCIDKITIPNVYYTRLRQKAVHNNNFVVN
jgi:hypothetical protein